MAANVLLVVLMSFVLRLQTNVCAVEKSYHILRGRELFSMEAKRVNDGYTFITALMDPDVGVVRLMPPLVDVPRELWNTTALHTPITIARNVTIEGDPDNWPSLRLNYVENVMRLADHVVLTIRFVFLESAYGDNPTRSQGFELLAATVPGQTAALWVGPAGMSIRVCFPKSYYGPSFNVPRPAHYPGAQLVDFGITQTGCINDSSAPPMQRCWANIALLIDVAGEGTRTDQSDHTIATNVNVWLRNVTAVCLRLVDIGCLMRQGEPLVCYQETVRQLEASDTAVTSASEGTPKRRVPISLVAGVCASVAGVVIVLLAAVALWFHRYTKYPAQHAFKAGQALEALEVPGAAGAFPGPCTDKCAADDDIQNEQRSDASPWPPPSSLLQPLPPPSTRSECTNSVLPERVVLGMDTVPNDAPVTLLTHPRPDLDLHVRLILSSNGTPAGEGSALDFLGCDTPLYTSQHPVLEITPCLSTDGGAQNYATGGGGCDGNMGVVELLPVVRGKGSFGRVVEGRYHGQPVAVKMIASQGPWGEPAEAFIKSFAQEVEVLSRCQHANVVRLLAACVEPVQLCLVLELMETSLARLIHGDPTAPLMTLPKVLHIAIAIANALAYLHPTITHRDLKPANVLINNGLADRPTVKLTDFGLARLRMTVVPTDHPDAGTPAYMAPECFDLQNKEVTHQADIFSLGVLLWEMLTGKRPWAGLPPLTVALAVNWSGARLPLGDLDERRCPQKLARLINACWETDPARRPAAAEAAKELVLVLQSVLGSHGGEDGHIVGHSIYDLPSCQRSPQLSLLLKPQREQPPPPLAPRLEKNEEKEEQPVFGRLATVSEDWATASQAASLETSLEVNWEVETGCIASQAVV